MCRPALVQWVSLPEGEELMDVDNTSGHGPASRVPPEIQGWNWGAFLLNWIWGIGNNALAALLVFVPLFGFIWLFVCGARGSEWAWRNKRWDSVAHFKATQRQWAKWGVILCLTVPVAIGALFFGIFVMLKDSEPYKLAHARLDVDERVVEIVGKPLSTGIPMGSIQFSGARGSAELSFSVEGPKGKGKAYLQARQELGLWRLDRLVFQDKATGRRIELTPTEPGSAAGAAAI